MKEHIQALRTYLASASGKELIIGAAIVVGVFAVIVVIVVLIQNSTTKIVYPPARACDLFTEQEAKEMLGEQVINSGKQNPSLSEDTVTSKCSYTDANTEGMMVAAVAIRSGVNDKGVEKNRADFAVGKQARNVETVNDMGDDAYFNPRLGQLNILNGYDWVILSFGLGSDPQSNTLEKAIELANNVITPASSGLPSF